MSAEVRGGHEGHETVFTSPIEETVEQSGDASAEKLDHKPVTTIDVRRHSEYDGGFPDAGWGKPNDEEKESLGHLTPEGRANAQRVAQELVERRLDEAGDNVDFLVVASPTFWLGDEQLGQRAIETAKFYSDAIKTALADRDLSPDHFINTELRPTSKQHEIGDVRQTDKMVEAQIFDEPESQKVVDRMRKMYGGQTEEFWDAWYAGTHDEELEAAGGEKSTETADRAARQMDVLIRFGEMHNKATGRSLEVIVLTHHEVLQPFALHELGVSQKDFTPGKNEGFEIRVEDGKAVATVAGQEVEYPPRSERHKAQEPEAS